MSKKQWIGLVLAFVLFAAILLYPEMNGLGKEGQRCLALFTAVFLLYIFESIPAAVISLAIVPLLVILRISDVNAALDGFASSSTYLVIGSFILTAAMIKTGLGKRITCHLLLWVGTSPMQISFGLMAVNILMAFLIPSSTARTAMLLPICLSVIKEYRGEEENQRRYGENLLLTLCVTSSTISAGIMTSTISNPMAVEYIQNTTGKTVSYGEWFLWGFPPSLVMTVLSWIVIQVCFHLKGAARAKETVKPRNKAESRESLYLKQELKEMGSVTGQELRTAAIIVFTVILWVFGSWWGVDSTTAALIGAVILMMPGCGVIKWNDCRSSVSLSVVFVISGGISLGDAMAYTGTADWLAKRVFGFLSGNIPLPVVIILVIIVVQFMHVFFVGTATMANAFFPILVSIAGRIGVSPLCIILPAAFMIGGYPVLLFFNTTPNILCYDTGRIRSWDFLKTGIPISVLACIVYGICAEWFWPLANMY